MSPISKLTATFFFCCAFLSASSQDKTIDSLKTVLKNPKFHDTTRLAAIALTSDLYNQSDPKAVYLNNLLGKLALKNYTKNQNPELRKKYAMYLAAYYNNWGNIYSDKRDVVKAWAFFDQSIAYFRFAAAYNEMNYVLVGKGIFLSRINEHEKAISCMFKALEFYEKDKKEYQDGIVYVQSCLATVYAAQGRHKASINYNNKVIDYYDHIEILTSEQASRKGSAYSNCGSSYLEMNNDGQAQHNFEKALALFKSIKDPLYTNIVLCKMARIKMREFKFDAAQALLREALAEGVPEVGIANAYVKMGELFYLKKDIHKADFYLTQGLSLSRKTKNLELQTQASDLLFKVSTYNKNFKKALEMFVFHDRLIDSAKTETSKNALAQQQLKYAFDKKEFNYKLNTAKQNAAKNNWLTLLAAALVLILSGGFFYYRQHKQKHAITLLEKDQIKQKLLISQMNPHFIFNSIHNIRNLIGESQNDAAVKYLDKFSILTRQILENSNENYISLAEEVEMIQNYLAIQQLLYNHKFEFMVTVEDSLDSESIFLPPMVTQPFIENAIKHGLVNKAQNGMVTIRFFTEDSKLFFEVCDNGKGFDKAKKPTTHKSLAMAITRERLIGYSKNKDFTVLTDNIKDKDENIAGAKVRFEIPYIYEN